MKHLAFLFLTCGSLALAAVDDEPPIRAGAMIEIHDWDARSRTFEIIMTAYPAQGPNYATLPSLIKAVPALNNSRTKSKPESLVGMSYKLDEELKLESVIKTEAKRNAK